MKKSLFLFNRKLHNRKHVGFSQSSLVQREWHRKTKLLLARDATWGRKKSCTSFCNWLVRENSMLWWKSRKSTDWIFEMSVTRERSPRSPDFYLLKSPFRSALYPQRCLLQEIFIRLSGQQSRITRSFHKHNSLKGKGSHKAHIPLSKGKVRQLQKYCLLQLICVMTFVRSFKIFLLKAGVNFTSIPKHTVNSLVVNY